MTELIEFFLQNLFESIVVFIILFLLIAYAFARNRFGAMLGGVFRIIASFFYSPFVYLKKAVLALAEYGQKGEAEFLETRQYLLNKLLLSFQGALVILSVAVLARGFVTAWSEWLPPKYLREAISELKKQLGQEKKELGQVAPTVEKMESSWAKQRDSLVRVYREERSNKAARLTTENQELVNRFASFDERVRQVFESIRQYHAQNEYHRQAAIFENVRDNVRLYYINPYLQEQEPKDLLNRYNDNWYAVMLAKLELSNFSERQLRSAIQPTYEALKTKLNELNSTIPYREEQLSQLRAQAKYNFSALFLQIAYTLLQFIIFVWIVGLIIEALWLSVHVAVNVQKLREHFETKVAE